MPEPILLLTDANGIYIPKYFSEMFPDLLDDDTKEVLSNPENEWYWDVWEDIINYHPVELEDDDGNKYFLYQQGDLWAIPVGWEWDEDKDWFVPPKEESNDLQRP